MIQIKVKNSSLITSKIQEIYMYNQFIILIYGYFILAWFGLIIKYTLRYMKVNEEEIEGVKGGGFVIGLLERILIFSFVLTNQYAAIAFIFAAKSLARFKGLEKREIAEYYLLGTFLSMTSAVVLGIFFVMLFGYIL